MKLVTVAPLFAVVLPLGILAKDTSKVLSFTKVVSVAVAIGRVLAQDPTMPFDDLFPTGTPEGSVSMTVEFDPDVDDGPADTESEFPDDDNENEEPFGALFLSSPNENALSDLSEASDWVLAQCDAKALHRQTVFAFCAKSMNGSSCAHVFKGHAEHTIVKMPKGCGKGPLARVHALGVHTGDLPAPTFPELARKLATEALYTLVFDYDFTLIPADNGPVYMRADVTDIPGYWDAVVNSPTDPGDKRRRALRSRRAELIRERGFFDSVSRFVDKINTVTKDGSARRRFEYKDTITLFNASKSCGAFNTQYGFFYEGTLVPPSVNKAFVYFNGDATAGATFTLAGTATVEYDSARVSFGTYGFPGLSVPGIIAVGPSLALEGYISGGVTVEGNVTADIEYVFPPVNFAVGPGSNIVSNQVNPVADPVNRVTSSLSAGVNVSANAALHVVPSVQLGISLVGGRLIDAQAYIEADLFAGIGLNTSVSNNSPTTFCVNPFFGVSLDAGVKGKVAFWKGQVGPFDFAKNQFSVASHCFTPGHNTVVPAFPVHGGSSSYPTLDAYNGAAQGERNLEKRAISLPGFINCPKQVTIKMESSAYQNTSIRMRTYVSVAYQYFSANQLDKARSTLQLVIQNRRGDVNHLITETYMMLGKIAVDHQEYADACIYYQHASNAAVCLSPARGGGTDRNLSIYLANKDMLKYLKEVLSTQFHGG
ncbi:hypothetical protein AURDEDRAFT_122709 [Auricularia subglabra TFB-10046 SS5]|nr:hypothetical protein AURDEDRAFT_122709 [Auricularia subglabra TFB-10046 SS5]